MDIKAILENFLNPPVLFFFLGMLAIFVKSNLHIPDQLLHLRHTVNHQVLFTSMAPPQNFKYSMKL